MGAPLELLIVRDGDRVRLASPSVGLFTGAVPPGEVLTPGRPAGALVTLGRSRTLIVPAGIAGRVANDVPDRVRAPVEWGAVLYELEGLEGLGGAAEVGAAAGAQSADGSLIVPSPQAGRFWHRSAPDDPPLVEVGTELDEGTSIGLVEVMKTFTQVRYAPTGALPARARVVRVLAGDGADVAQGEPLVEVEPR